MVYWNLSMQLIKTDDDPVFFHGSPPTRLSNPWHLCAPELLYSMPLDKSVDMWNMRCLVSDFCHMEYLGNCWLILVSCLSSSQEERSWILFSQQEKI